jgi:hypothetical protein
MAKVPILYFIFCMYYGQRPICIYFFYLCTNKASLFIRNIILNNSIVEEVLLIMSSELELLRYRITELEAENAQKM